MQTDVEIDEDSDGVAGATRGGGQSIGGGGGVDADVQRDAAGELGERRVGAGVVAENLRPLFHLESIGRGGGADQLAVLVQGEKVVAREHQRAGAVAIFAPLHLSGFEIDAAKIAALLLAAVEAVEATVAVDGGGVMGG